MAEDDLDKALNDDTSDDDDSGQGDDTGEDEAPWTPPTKDEWDAAQGKLAKARKEAQKLRERKAAETNAAAASGAEADKQRADELTAWQKRAVAASGRAALLEAGADSGLVDLALSRLKPTEIDWDEDGKPDLDSWLDDMKDRYPKLFDSEHAPARANARGTGPSQGAGSGRVGQSAGQNGGRAAKLSLGAQAIANANKMGRRALG